MRVGRRLLHDLVTLSIVLLCACADRGEDQGLPPPDTCDRPAVWPPPDESAQTLYDAFAFLFTERPGGDGPMHLGERLGRDDTHRRQAREPALGSVSLALVRLRIHLPRS